jgi:hypothetical protein
VNDIDQVRKNWLHNYNIQHSPMDEFGIDDIMEQLI